MKTTLLITAALLPIIGQFAHADDLFSDVLIDSVYESNEAGTTTSPTTQTQIARRIDDVNGLAGLLTDIGMASDILSENQVKTLIKRDEWSIPCLLMLDGEKLTIVMKLTNTSETTEITDKQLLAMMQASLNSGSGMLVVNQSVQQIQLRSNVRVSELNSSVLKSKLSEMTALAMATTSLWDIGEKTSDASSQSTSTPSTKILTGTWIATPADDEAFALSLTDAGTFRLIFIQGKKNLKSSGKFTLTDDQLNLTGDDGTTISGTVVTEKDGFALKISESKTLSFTRSK